MEEMSIVHMAATGLLRATFIPLLVASVTYAVREIRQARLGSPHYASLLAGVFCVALVVRLTLPHWGFFHDFYHGYGMVERWMASSGSRLFGDGVPVGESYYGPGAAACWGVLFQIVPKDERILFAAGAAVSALTVVPVALLTRQIIGGRYGGLLAGLLWAFWPVSVRMAPTEDSSNLATFWMWLGLWLTAGLSPVPQLGRMFCAALAISFAVQTRDTMQIALLFVAVLARFQLRGLVAASMWVRGLTFAFWFNAPFLMLYFGWILPEIWTRHGDLFALTPWYFSWASPRNPLLNFALTPLFAMAASVLAVTSGSEPGRALRRALGATTLAANFVACVKTYTPADVHMFHLHYLPALALLAEWGLRIHVASCSRASLGRAAGGLALALSLAVPGQWSAIIQGYVDQQEYAFVRRALLAVPRGCTIVFPQNSERRIDILMGGELEVAPHMPWIWEERSLDVRSFSWFRNAPSTELGRCLYVLRPLVCSYSATGVSDAARVSPRPPQDERCAGRPDAIEEPVMSAAVTGDNRNLFVALHQRRSIMSLSTIRRQDPPAPTRAKSH